MVLHPKTVFLLITSYDLVTEDGRDAVALDQLDQMRQLDTRVREADEQLCTAGTIFDVTDLLARAAHAGLMDFDMARRMSARLPWLRLRTIETAGWHMDRALELVENIDLDEQPWAMADAWTHALAEIEGVPLLAVERRVADIESDAVVHIYPLL